MSGISATAVRELREKTGAGMMDCKKALQENNGDMEKAVDFLRTKGLAAAAKKSGRIASEGAVGSYIHMGGKIGVLAEINCETDFVARGDEFQNFVKDITMHIAAANPRWLKPEEIPLAELNREKEIFIAQMRESGKPENVIEKIVEGKIRKFAEENCLLNQPFVKNPDQTIEELRTAMVAKIGENIQIRRFVRFELGEGIEKKEENFAEEIAKMQSSAKN